MREDSGWLDVQRPLYASSGASFLTLLSQPQSGGVGNYRHLTLVTDGVATALTSGRLVVTGVYGWDEVNAIVSVQLLHTLRL
jgi:hypothetical protein